MKIVGSATWRRTQPSDGVVRIAALNFEMPSLGQRDCCGPNLASRRWTRSNMMRRRKLPELKTKRGGGANGEGKKAAEAIEAIRTLDP